MSSKELREEIAFKGDLFSKHFIDSKAIFLYQFHKLPSITIVRQVDHEKFYNMLQKDHPAQIISEYHYSAIHRKRKEQEKEESLIHVEEELVLELGDGYCEFYFSNPNGELLKKLIAKVSSMRGLKKNKPQEINLITRGDYGLELTRMDVKRTRLNLDL